jgi:multisubunit Na+/H+ antiporter MnhC subunit
MDGIVSFAQNHAIIAIVIVLGLIFFMIRKPKLFFSIFSIGLVLAGLFYIIMILAGSGSEKKTKLLEEKEEQSDTNR